MHQLSEHSVREAERVSALVTEALKSVYNERGARIWWITRRPRLAMLTPAELLDLGCFETIFLEVSRAIGTLPDVTQSSRYAGSHVGELLALLRDVTHA